MRRIFTLAGKDLLETRRDRLALIFTVVMPIAFTAFFGLLFGGGSNRLPLAVWSGDAGPVATQLVSPLLWDHYAVILLLPVAWLLGHGARWAVAIPLATSLLLLWVVPAAIYPIVFWAALVGPFTIRSDTAALPAQAHPQVLA